MESFLIKLYFKNREVTHQMLFRIFMRILKTKPQGKDILRRYNRGIVMLRKGHISFPSFLLSMNTTDQMTFDVFIKHYSDTLLQCYKQILETILQENNLWEEYKTSLLEQKVGTIAPYSDFDCKYTANIFWSLRTSDIISNAFLWKNTPSGHDTWQRINYQVGKYFHGIYYSPDYIYFNLSHTCQSKLYSRNL